MPKFPSFLWLSSFSLCALTIFSNLLICQWALVPPFGYCVECCCGLSMWARAGQIPPGDPASNPSGIRKQVFWSTTNLSDVHLKVLWEFQAGARLTLRAVQLFYFLQENCNLPHTTHGRSRRPCREQEGPAAEAQAGSLFSSPLVSNLTSMYRLHR